MANYHKTVTIHFYHQDPLNAFIKLFEFIRDLTDGMSIYLEIENAYDHED